MKINIYQIYYKQSQLESLDQAFTPYDNTINSKPEWREFYVFNKAFREGNLFKGCDYTGFMSWKFEEKTKIKGSDFINFIKQNPGYDIYIINPFPKESKIHSNIWEQGERWHPGIINLTKSIFNLIGFNYNFNSPHPENLYSFCNFWVGNENFWNAYMELASNIQNTIEHKLPYELKNQIQQKTAHYESANFIPFIYERLITTMLTSGNYDFKVKQYEYSTWFDRKLRALKKALRISKIN